MSDETKPKYKRSHSAMNTKVVIPAFNISGGRVVGAGEGGKLPADPLELVKSIGIVGEVRYDLRALRLKTTTARSASTLRA